MREIFIGRIKELNMEITKLSNAKVRYLLDDTLTLNRMLLKYFYGEEF